MTMSTGDAVVALCTALVPVLAAVGGAIRYLVRILATIERVTSLAQTVTEQLERHITQSTSAHEQLSARVAEHDKQLAVVSAVQARISTGPAPAGGTV